MFSDAKFKNTNVLRFGQLQKSQTELRFQQANSRSQHDLGGDIGSGIAASERARIFQPFYRFSSLLSDGVAGTGIGLDIARQSWHPANRPESARCQNLAAFVLTTR